MMKKTITLAILALTPICFAQGGDKERKGPKKPPPHIVEKFDTDGDGQLNEAERAAAKEARESKREEMKAVRDSYDVDGDGKLNESEKEAFKAHVREKIIERFDEDGDGALNSEELEKANEAKRHFKDRKEKRGERGSQD